MIESQKANSNELFPELCRKGIHMLIAFVPTLASIDRSNTALLLMGGIYFYITAESLRFLGFSLPFISPVTRAVLRKREEGHFALAPVTLGLGALLSLLLFPTQAAAVAIYTLAFGDSASTLAGKFLGRLRPAFMAGKSIEGSIACFIVSTMACYFVLHDWRMAFAVGFVSMLAEALPLRAFDNLFLPLVTGVAVLAASAVMW